MRVPENRHDHTGTRTRFFGVALYTLEYPHVWEIKNIGGPKTWTTASLMIEFMDEHQTVFSGRLPNNWFIL